MSEAVAVWLYVAVSVSAGVLVRVAVRDGDRVVVTVKVDDAAGDAVG